MRFSVFFFLLIALPCLADEPIVVKLKTDSSLLPLYLSCPESLKDVASILRFDLSYSGKTQVLATDAAKESQIEADLRVKRFSQAAWKKFGAAYVVSVREKDNKLEAYIYQTDSNQLRVLSDWELGSDAGEIRRRVHNLSDAIFKNFFGIEGIASTRMLFTARTSAGHNEVFEADYDGANMRQVTSEEADCLNPVYLPAKSGYTPGSFFYVSYRKGQPRIYIAPLRSGKGKAVCRIPANQFMPMPNKSRSKLAFVTDPLGRADLFVQDFDPEIGLLGKPQQIFTAYRTTASSPSFSPDGSKLAFISDKTGSPRVYMMRVPVSGGDCSQVNLELVSKESTENTCCAWSPDGKKIAYTAMTKGVRQIWVYDIATRKETQLTKGGEHKENPTWSANSLHLMYDSHADGGTCSLWLHPLAVPTPVKIVAASKNARFASLEPRSI